MPHSSLLPAHLGKSPDVSRRYAAALHLECGGTRQPALSQEATQRLPGAYASADPCAPCTGYVARSTSRRPATNARLTPSGTGWINPVSLLQSRYFFFINPQYSSARI